MKNWKFHGLEKEKKFITCKIHQNRRKISFIFPFFQPIQKIFQLFFFKKLKNSPIFFLHPPTFVVHVQYPVQLFVKPDHCHVVVLWNIPQIQCNDFIRKRWLIIWRLDNKQYQIFSLPLSVGFFPKISLKKSIVYKIIVFFFIF